MMEIKIKGPPQAVAHACKWILWIVLAATTPWDSVLDHAVEQLKNI